MRCSCGSYDIRNYLRGDGEFIPDSGQCGKCGNIVEDQNSCNRNVWDEIDSHYGLGEWGPDPW